MKKSIALVAMAFGVTSAFAQDLTDKKGRAILPEEKDWGISVDATPFIDFASDLVHIGAAGSKSAPTFKSVNDKNAFYSVAGKYFKNSTTAYRGILSLSQKKNTTVNFEDKFSTTPSSVTWPNTADAEKVRDVKHERNWHVGIGAGIEKRKGTKYRLQGYYGADLSLIVAGGGKNYRYGNDVVANTASSELDNNLSLYTTDFGNNLVKDVDKDSRILAQRNGITLGIAARGFVGVEYFFSSKMSIGGEFGWGLGWSRTGRAKTISEGLDLRDDKQQPYAANSEVIVDKTKEKTGSITREFFVGSDNTNTASPNQLWMNTYSPSGNLKLNFYF